MKILGISGSPNRNGNTAFAVRHALAILEAEGADVEYLSLAGLPIGGCIGCWRCADGHRCFQDDAMGPVLEALRRCDGLILGSPVYMGMVSGQMKTFMDRCVCLRPSYDQPMELSGKVGGGIACGGFRNGGQESTLQNIHTFLMQQNLGVVGDGQGFGHAGGTIVGQAATDTLGLKTVENLARNLLRSRA